MAVLYLLILEIILVWPLLVMVIAIFTTKGRQPGWVTLISLVCAIISFFQPIAAQRVGLLDEFGFWFMVMITFNWPISLILIVVSIVYAVKALKREMAL